MKEVCDSGACIEGVLGWVFAREGIKLHNKKT
jgi:hypothetical protein